MCFKNIKMLSVHHEIIVPSHLCGRIGAAHEQIQSSLRKCFTVNGLLQLIQSG